MIKELPVKLTEEELRAKGDEIAKAAADINSLEQEKAAASSDLGGQIKNVRKHISMLAQQITSRHEMRDVVCREQADWEANLMLTIRTDTDEIIERRVLTHEERQQKLKIVPFERGQTGTDSAEPVSPVEQASE